MSAILAVCGENFCAMVSDGRMVEEPLRNDKPNIITNDLPKLRKVNPLDEYDTRYLTLEKAVKILREKAQTVQTQPVGVRLLVGGRGRKGGFLLTSLGSEDGYEPQTQQARPGAYLIEGACSHTDVGP